MPLLRVSLVGRECREVCESDNCLGGSRFGEGSVRRR